MSPLCCSVNSKYGDVLEKNTQSECRVLHNHMNTHHIQYIQYKKTHTKANQQTQRLMAMPAHTRAHTLAPLLPTATTTIN